MGDRAALVDVIESVADGGNLDWGALEAQIDNESDRRLLEQLKILARIAEVHRSQPEEPDDYRVPAKNVERFRLVSRSMASLAATGPQPAPSSFRPTETLKTSKESAKPGSWGHLQLLECVGHGTFGDVYRAKDTGLNREVAVKLLRQNAAPTDRLSRRLLREARVLARVEHPNVVAVHGAEVFDGRVGLWMEFIRGNTLEQLLKAQGPYSAKEAALIGQELCRALAAVHNTGLVHRDVKAQNVMRGERGRLVLMDFGAGQLAGEGQRAAGRITGTPLYLAPEILAGEEATVRSDIYSLGVLLYHLVTGEYPIRGASIDELQRAHEERRLVRLHDARPDLPDSFVNAVETALAGDPLRRFSSAGELQAALALSLGANPHAQWDMLDHAAGLGGRRQGPVRHSWQAYLKPLGGVAALLAVLAAGVYIVKDRQSPRALTGAATPSRIRSLAIIPLTPLTPASAQYASALTDRLNTALGSLGHGLIVKSQRSSALAVQRASVIADIGTMLDAEAVMQGSVLRRSDDMLQLDLKMVGAQSSQTLWEQSFVLHRNQGPKLVEDVKREVARVLGLTPPADLSGGAVGGGLTAEAMEAHAHGRELLKDWGFEDVKKALGEFERAVSLDPNLAVAYADIAFCYLRLGNDSQTRTLAETARPIKFALDRALTLDPNLADAWAVQAEYQFEHEWNWADAEASFRRALELNPSHEYALHRYAAFLAARGRLDEAIDRIEKARDVAPLSHMVLREAASIYRYGHQYDKSEALYRQVLELNPQLFSAHYGLARTLRADGKYQDALAELQLAAAPTPVTLGDMAQVHALAGRRDRALENVRQLLAQKDAALRPERFVYVYAALGDRDRAFEWLEKAFEARVSPLVFLAVDERVAPLRGDPRFAEYLKRLGL